MNLARRGQDLFPEKEDMENFLDLLKETSMMLQRVIFSL